MAFNAGSIEATLTLNRTPFTAGLRLARRQAQDFARERYQVTITPVLRAGALTAIRQRIAAVAGRIDISLRISNAELAAVRQRISSVAGRIDISLRLSNSEIAAIRSRLAAVVGRIDVRLNLVSGEIAAIQARIRAINPPILRVRLGILAGEITALRARIAAIDAAVGVRLNLSAAEIAALRARIAAIGGGRIDIDLNVRGSRRLNGAFQNMDRTVRLVLALLPLLVPVAASAITGVVGLLGGLISILGVAAAGFGALALVAVPVFNRISEAVKLGQAEIDKLPPGVREAANALRELQVHYRALVMLTEANVGLAMAEQFKAATAAMMPLRHVIRAAADAVADIGKQMQEYFNSSHYEGFVNFLTNNVAFTFQKLFEIVVYLTRAVMNLIVAFDPLADWLLESIAQGMKDFAQWAAELASNQEFYEWLELVKRSLEAVWKFLVSVVEFIFALSTALAPLGNIILDLFTRLFDTLSSMPPEQLAALAQGIFVLVSALILGASGPAALFIGVLAGIAAGLIYLYETNENVRRSINEIINDLRTRFLPIWESIQKNITDHVIPAWEALVEAFNQHVLPVLEFIWNHLLNRVVPAIQSLADTITQRVIPAILDFFTQTAPIWAALILLIGTTLVEAFVILVRAVEGSLIIIAGVFQAFTGLFTADWETFWMGLQTIAEGFWTIVAGLFGMNLDQLAAQFRAWDVDLRNIWNGFWGGMVTDQEGYQTQVSGSWNDFWAQSARNFQSQLVDPVTRGWNQFWSDTNANTERNSALLKATWERLWGGLYTYFQGVGDRLKAFWETTLASIRTITDNAATAIGTAFRKIANLFREPINWVIRVVINDGILTAWNTVMGWIGAPGLSAGRVPEIPSFATGGPINGRGNGTSDSILARVSNGEFIIREEIASKIGGFLAALNSGSSQAMMIAGAVPGYAPGGLVGSAIGAAGGLVGISRSWWTQLAAPITSLFAGIPKQIPGATGAIGQAMQGIPKALVDKVVVEIRKKLTNLFMPTPAATIGAGVGALGAALRGSAGVFDNGGYLMPGPLNGTSKPEPVLTSQQWDALMYGRTSGSPDVVRKLDQVIEVLERIGMKAFVSKSSSANENEDSGSERQTLLNLRLTPR